MCYEIKNNNQQYYNKRYHKIMKKILSVKSTPKTVKQIQEEIILSNVINQMMLTHHYTSRHTHTLKYVRSHFSHTNYPSRFPSEFCVL